MLLFWLSAQPAALLATAQPRFVTTAWPEYTDPAGTGMYLEVVDRALGKGAYSIYFRPWPRAVREMREGRFDAIIGVEPVEEGFLYPRWAIDNNELSVAFKRTTLPAWPGPKALERHTLGWTRGYPVEVFAERAGIRVPRWESFVELEMGIAMLKADRFQVLVDYSPDIEEAMDRLNIDASQYVIAPLALDAGVITVGFRKDASGRELARRFDEGMDAAARDGTLEAIFRKYRRGHRYEAIRRVEHDKRPGRTESSPPPASR